MVAQRVIDARKKMHVALSAIVDFSKIHLYRARCCDRNNAVSNRQEIGIEMMTGFYRDETLAGQINPQAGKRIGREDLFPNGVNDNVNSVALYPN